MNSPSVDESDNDIERSEASFPSTNKDGRSSQRTSRGIKRKYHPSREDEGTSSQSTSRNEEMDRSDPDDALEDEWEQVSIPYSQLPTDLLPAVTALRTDDTDSMNTYSTFPDSLQNFSIFRSLDEEDGQSSITSSTMNVVLDHVYVRRNDEPPTDHQGDIRVDQESPSTSNQGHPVARRLPTTKKKRSVETSAKGLFSDVPLQSFVLQQIRMRHPYLTLSPRASMQVEMLLSDMVDRIADEAKNLVALSKKKHVDSRVLKYAIKLMLEHLKKEGDAATGRSSAWLF